MTESTETTFWQRLGEAMEDNGMKHSQTGAGALIGSKGNTAARKWEYGGYPSMTNAIIIAVKLGVCVEWLLTGRGAKYPIEGPMTETELRVLLSMRAGDNNQNHDRRNQPRPQHTLHEEIESYNKTFDEPEDLGTRELANNHD